MQNDTADAGLVTHADVVALLPPGIADAFAPSPPAATAIPGLAAEVERRHRAIVRGGGRDPHAAHVLFAWHRWRAGEDPTGWLQAAAGMGGRHGVDPRTVVLADALAAAYRASGAYAEGGVVLVPDGVHLAAGEAVIRVRRPDAVRRFPTVAELLEPTVPPPGPSGVSSSWRPADYDG